MPEKKDNYSHRRSGKSRQYLIELKKETVDIINDRLCDVVDAFGFNEKQ